MDLDNFVGNFYRKKSLKITFLFPASFKQTIEEHMYQYMSLKFKIINEIIYEIEILYMYKKLCNTIYFL